MTTIGKYTATMTKVQEAQPLGTYKPTSIDERKANADILIKYANGGSFTIHSKVELKGRGVKAYATEGMYEVSTNRLDSLLEAYKVEPDF